MTHNQHLKVLLSTALDEETEGPIIEGCFMCEHSSAAFYELEGKMAVHCALLEKELPERSECEHFQINKTLFPEEVDG